MCESDKFPSGVIYAIADHVILEIVGGRHHFERIVGFGFFHRKVQQINTVVGANFEMLAGQVEGIKGVLCFTQSHIGGGELQQLLGVSGRKPQRVTAINNIFTQSESHVGDAFVGQLGSNRIKINGSCHARNGRIKSVAIPRPAHLLQHDAHLLFVDDVERGRHVGAAIMVICRGINALNRQT